MSINIIILLLSSGFAGALAGGVVSLFGQYLQRRWNREDHLRNLKIDLYGEIISMGSHYVGKTTFSKLNNVAARTLLICGDEVRVSLIKYVTSVETVNKKLKGITDMEEIKNILAESTKENTNLHKKLVSDMKNELSL